MQTIILILIGLVAGFIITYIIEQSRIKKLNESKAKLSEDKAVLNTRLEETEKQIAEWKQIKQELDAENNALQKNYEAVREEKAKLETKIEEAQKNIEEQKQLIKKSTKELTNTFSSLSSKALKENNEEFLKLAKQNLENVLEKTKNEFGKEAIENTLKPLKNSLERYDNEIKQMEKSRQKAYGGLLEQVKNMKETNIKLQDKTSTLVNALKRPEVRGRWGEITLRRIVELVGLSEHCDFSEQESRKSEGGILRPDMVVYLPGDRRLVVDAKTPFNRHFLNANEATSEEKRQASKKAYARAVRNYMKKLSRKQYWAQFDKSPDFVIMFLPGESWFSAALELDKDLFEDSLNNKVIIATPATLIALLRTVAHSWQQQKVAENAKLIAERGKELYERLAVFQKHLSKVRKNLDSTVKNYNAAIGSLNSRVLPSARKMEELGIQETKKNVEEIEPIERTTREIKDDQ